MREATCCCPISTPCVAVAPLAGQSAGELAPRLRQLLEWGQEVHGSRPRCAYSTQGYESALAGGSGDDSHDLMTCLLRSLYQPKLTLPRMVSASRAAFVRCRYLLHGVAAMIEG